MSPCYKMAYSAEADEDFKLPLRPWLEKQINSGKFTGLQWEPCAENSKEFRLPWVKKNSPNWEVYYQIFRAWAEHRGRGESEKLDDSKLKSNFRCALNKSVDFEEVVAKSQLHRQTGNYKVYRFLTPKEVRDKKKKRTKVAIKQERGSLDEFNTFDKKTLDTMDSLSQFQQLSPVASNVSQNDAYMWSDGDSGHSEVTVSPTDPITSPHVVFPVQSDTNHNSWLEVVSMEEDCTETIPVSKEKNFIEETEQSAKALILQQLENGGIKQEQLRECQVIVTYDGEKVLDVPAIRMDEGCRIFYGNKDEQIRLLEKSKAISDEKLEDLKLTSIDLPPAPQRSSTMSAILDKTELGLIIRYDPQRLQFHVKRLCAGQVFFYDPHDHLSNALPTKLERNETVPLFSHEKYFMEYMQQYLNTQNVTPPEARIILTVGVKPKSRLDLQTMNGLKIELIPQALKICLWTSSTLDSPTFRSRETVFKT